MASARRSSLKRKLAVKVGFSSLSSFKVPKKSQVDSLLESVSTESSDFLDDLLPQIIQSFRFPNLSSYLKTHEAWLVHNRRLEQSFISARKRLQNCSSGLGSSSDANLCTGFLAVSQWSEVERIANEGLSIGNTPDTWLGRPDSGVVVNQCADLVVARTQKRLSRQSSATGGDPPSLYVIVVRWVRSKAYIVPMEAEDSEDRLEPQPGYASHVTTWSRLDPLDPSKLNLERAYKMAQVYLYDFNEDLELRQSPEHVIPYAVIKCHWELTPTIASDLDPPLASSTGSILIVPLRKTRPPTSSAPTSLLPLPISPPLTDAPLRGALLPTPPMSMNLFASAGPPRSLRNDTFGTNLKTSQRVDAKIGKRRVRQLPNSSSPTRSSHTNRSKSERKTSEPIEDPFSSSSTSLSSPSSTDKPNTVLITKMDPGIKEVRQIQSSPDFIARLTSDYVNTSLIPSDPAPTSVCNLLGVTRLTWGKPSLTYSALVEVCTTRRTKVPVFDCILQPSLHVGSLIPTRLLHYELAGLTPCDPATIESGGPPVLVSIPRDQEWCLPRLTAAMATSLQCSPSLFAGYRGNYYKFKRHVAPGTKGGVDEMSQLCEFLQDQSLAGMIHMNCDEASRLIVFPDCPFARSISFSPSDELDKTQLHAILLTHHSLDHYPYKQARCLRSSLSNPSTDPIPPPPQQPPSVTADLLFGQRKSGVPLPEMKLKIPLDALMSTLPNGGRDLLGTTLMNMLASRRGGSDLSIHTPAPSNADDTEEQHRQNPVPITSQRKDPRLNRYTEVDTFNIATALLSTVAKNPDLFKRSTTESPSILAQPICSPPPAEPTPPSPQQSIINEEDSTDLVIDESEDYPIASPPAPASPIVAQNPKEIPLSTSSPEHHELRIPINHDTTTDSVDMDIIVRNDQFPSDALRTSDMEVNSSNEYADSPLKLRFYPGPHVHSFTSPYQPLHCYQPHIEFSYPTPIEQQERESFSSLHDFPLLTRAHPSDTCNRYNQALRLPVDQTNDSLKLPMEQEYEPSPPASFRDWSNHSPRLPATRIQHPLNGPPENGPPQREWDARPPSFQQNPVVDEEGEEGEVVDDDETVDDYEGSSFDLDKKENLSSSYSCISSDLSLTHSSNNAECDVSRSHRHHHGRGRHRRSSRSSGGGRRFSASSNSNKSSKVYKHDRRKQVRNNHEPVDVDCRVFQASPHHYPLPPTTEQHSNTQSRLIDGEYKLIDEVHSPIYIESSLEDEDMRVYQPVQTSNSFHRRSLRPSPPPPTSGRLAKSDNDMRIPPDRMSDDNRMVDLGSFDMDYRRLSNDSHVDPRRSRDSLVSESSYPSFESENSHKYTVYQPKVSQDNSYPSNRLHGYFSQEQLPCAYPLTNHVTSSNNDHRISSDLHRPRRRDSPHSAEPPITKRSSVASRDLSSHPLPFPFQPSSRGLLDDPPSRQSHFRPGSSDIFWTATKLLSQNNPLYPSPWN